MGQGQRPKERPMLVVISDLHLTDGTSGTTISADAFRLLADRLAELAASASARADGSYRPIEQLDLVLLGDVLDVIRSTRWLGAQVRPWDDPQSPAAFELISTITGDILRRNDAALGVLRSLAQGLVRLAPADRMGRRSVTGEAVPVPVRVHYMVGNHDWFFHLPGTQYNRLRRQIAAHMGLATEPDVPFPHEPWESRELLETMRRHRVLARHGDAFDPLNHDGTRDTSSIGDVIVVELVSRFGVQVERELGPDLPPATRAGLREIDNVRPLLLVPVWIDGLLERTCPSAALRHRVKQTWDTLAEACLEQPFVRLRDSWRPRDLIDGLQRALRLSRHTPTGWASSIAQWLCQVRGASSSSYYNHALAEEDFRNRRARHFIYGHTHEPDIVPLDASYADSYVLNQMYFNSGTWRRVYHQTQLAPAEHEFIASDALTLLAFFQGDERGGRPYETWTGTLGINPNEALLGGRVDAPAAVDAAPVRAPHFTMAPATASVSVIAGEPSARG
jgi:UDP-2,3-diacylglucosamine pyrophosphatase LpxH